MCIDEQRAWLHTSALLHMHMHTWHTVSSSAPFIVHIPYIYASPAQQFRPRDNDHARRHHQLPQLQQTTTALLTHRTATAPTH